MGPPHLGRCQPSRLAAGAHATRRCAYRLARFSRLQSTDLLSDSPHHVSVPPVPRNNTCSRRLLIEERPFGGRREKVAVVGTSKGAVSNRHRVVGQLCGGRVKWLRHEAVVLHPEQVPALSLLCGRIPSRSEGPQQPCLFVWAIERTDVYALHLRVVGTNEYRNCRPSGRNCGQRCEFSVRDSSIVVSGTGRRRRRTPSGSVRRCIR